MLKKYLVLTAFALGIPVLLLLPSLHAQQLAKRLILKDGSYQLATRWEVKGDRVRYLSAERNEWEEVPNSLVDWAATEKFEKDRAAGVPDADAVELDKEMEAERKAEEARTPQVAPGLRLPDDSSVLLLDTVDSQPELVILEQNAGELNRNMKTNVLRAAINPISGSKQTIELEGLHAKAQAHVSMPAIYVNVQSNEPQSDGQQPEKPQQPQQPEQPWDRFHIVRAQLKKDRRIVGDIKINPLGKSSQEQNLVLTDSQRLTGGWVKVTPIKPLEPGEYALVELLGKDGMNTYVWDFGVNSSAPANTNVLKPDVKVAQPQPDKPRDMQTQR
jgi:hypothetical protein